VSPPGKFLQFSAQTRDQFSFEFRKKSAGVLYGDEEKTNMLPLIIQLISGAVGGNIAGALMKNFNLGPIGNSIAGLIGGGLGGQLLSMLTSGGAATAGMAATGSGMDVASILSSLAGGGVGGAVVMAIVGLIKAKMAKSS
jgi:uncharacterized membrane protein YeaQ/YmgE (transglycosylase-associated protein family)